FREGLVDEAEGWFSRAAEAGKASAMESLGALLCEQGRVNEAEHWCGRLADAGEYYHLERLLALLKRADGWHDDDEERWLTRTATAGSAQAMTRLGRLLFERGRSDEAEQWLRRAI